METLTIVAATIFVAGIAVYYFLQKKGKDSELAVEPEPSPEAVEPEMVETEPSPELVEQEVVEPEVADSEMAEAAPYVSEE